MPACWAAAATVRSARGKRWAPCEPPTANSRIAARTLAARRDPREPLASRPGFARAPPGADRAPCYPGETGSRRRYLPAPGRCRPRSEPASGRGWRVEAIDGFEVKVELLGVHRLEQGLGRDPAVAPASSSASAPSTARRRRSVASASRVPVAARTRASASLRLGVCGHGDSGVLGGHRHLSVTPSSVPAPDARPGRSGTRRDRHDRSRAATLRGIGEGRIRAGHSASSRPRFFEMTLIVLR